jgi:phage gp29-like protein
MAKKKTSASFRESLPEKKSVVLRAVPLSKYSFRTSQEAWWLVHQQLPNPDVVLAKRNRNIHIYKELLSDDHLGAVLESRESASLSFEWRLERGDAPVRLYKAVEKWFFSIIERKLTVGDLSRDELTDNLLDVIYYGYQPAELTWDFMYGLWLPVAITPKPPEWFAWFINEQGIPEIRFISKEHPIQGEAPPDPWTLICPRVKPSYDNPYGRGVASRCFWPIVFKRSGIEFWMNFLERFAVPWVKGKIEGSSSTTELQEFAHDLRSMVQDAVIAVSGTRDVEILESKSASSGRGGGSAFKELADFMNSGISKTVLGHTLSTETGGGGYAATKGALVVRDDIVKRDRKMITSIYSDVINLIYLRNGFYDIARPILKSYDPDAVETERASRDESLSRAGVEFTKKYFVRTYNLSEDDIAKVNAPANKDVSAPSVSSGGVKDKPKEEKKDDE